MTQYAIPVIVLVHSSTYATHKPRGQTSVPMQRNPYQQKNAGSISLTHFLVRKAWNCTSFIKTITDTRNVKSEDFCTPTGRLVG